MCNACGFLCCALDTFDKCGCDHCPEEDCHDPACFNCGLDGCDGECAADDDIFHLLDGDEPEFVS